MSDYSTHRREFLKSSSAVALGTLAAFGVVATYGPVRAAKPFNPAASLVDAASKEGEVVLYTAAFPEVMQDTTTWVASRRG